jgi:hypothetical protein
VFYSDLSSWLLGDYSGVAWPCMPAGRQIRSGRTKLVHLGPARACVTEQPCLFVADSEDRDPAAIRKITILGTNGTSRYLVASIWRELPTTELPTPGAVF